MIRFVFTFILFIHGLIHLLGFVKEYNLAKVEGFTGKTLIQLSAAGSKALGFFWLLTCLLLIVTAVTFLLKKEWWWMVAAAAVLLSQVLITIYWQDAKFGTIANIIVIVAIILSYSSWRFNTMIQQELKSFLPKSNYEQIVVTKNMIITLPPVVQRWIIRSNIIGKELIHTVYLKQQGRMRTKPDGNWMRVEAEEYFTIDKPGFIWIANVKAAPFIHLSGRDKYENGRGQMLIKLLSLFPVADAKGKETDQGTLLRYLGEVVWFPSAALSDYITWEEIDATKAKATMSYGGIKAWGIFTFTEKGDIASFEAQRYFDRKEGPTLEKWLITIDKDGYREFEGIRIPAKSAVTWKLKNGNFTWYRLEISNIVYNPEIQSTEILALK